MVRSRYRLITSFFARQLASLIIWELAMPRIGLRKWSRRTRSARLRRFGVAYRSLAIALGGVMIKVGQFLSARVDVLPEEITAELAGLQDEVPAEDFSAIRHLAEMELGGSLDEQFAFFDEIPLAAASLGQVHRARLKTLYSSSAEGSSTNIAVLEDVVVKIQRPDIETLIATDLAALDTVGRWIQRYPPVRRRADVPALLKEFKRVLYEEIDYLAEGRNLVAFAEDFKGDPGIQIPAIDWEHTTQRVLTMEDVFAIKITDYPALKEANIDRAAVAERLFAAYMAQLFDHGLVHADPHPGNLFVQPAAGGSGASGSWQLTFVDFGMVAHVTPPIREGIRLLAIGLVTQDPERLIKSYQKMGILLPGADLAAIEKAGSRIFSQIWGKSMSELQALDINEVREYADEFRDLLYELPFQIPQDLIFLGRTVAILSGMCTGIYPDFNFWEQLAPYARRYLAEEAGSNWETWLAAITDVLRSLSALPRRLDSTLSQIEAGRLKVQIPELDRQVARLDLAVNRLVAAVIFSGLTLAGVQLFISGYIGAGGVFFAGALISLLGLRGKRR
jgi:predicted unusual protein kinase regulating ubiquinone biosynthesis (AarF/ABC1/UbiB family)